MVIATESVSVDGTSYTVQVSNLRQYATGIAAIDVGVKRDGTSAIIQDNSIRFVSPAGRSLDQGLPSPPSGRFNTETAYLPAAANTVTATWTGQFGNQTPQIQFSFSGLGGETVGPCSFTNVDGTVPQTTGGVETGEIIQRAFQAGVLEQDETSPLINAWFNDGIYQPCVGSNGGGGNGNVGGGRQGGISPAVVGIGVLGLGALAVALSQRDE